MLSEKDKLGITGISLYAKNLREEIKRIASGDFSVLILGDSGTGKEVIANAIHDCSLKKNKKIVSINCAAIPKDLEESEFFGHVKGAFTGAYQEKQGFFSIADNSTIFLDEIGEVSLQMQAKFLRVLDVGEFFPVGSTKAEKVNVRVVSATNQDIEKMVEEKTFRQDLYYRIKGITITTLPLCKHCEDIPELSEYFLKAQKKPNIPQKITNDALELLIKYQWPGNIRELKNTIEVLSIAGLGKKEIDEDLVRAFVNIDHDVASVQQKYKEAKANVLFEFESVYFITLLNHYKGNINQAASAAGMYRPNLLDKLKRLNISANNYRPNKK